MANSSQKPSRKSTRLFSIEKYRSLRKTILILGETGTGKRIIAEALHSGPRDKYFKINCADYAGKPELLRSELFGHVKGAFTGALYEKRGLLEAASGGTFVLDEVHLLGMEGQAQLLTAIEEKLIRRMGGTKDIPIDVTIIAIAKPELKQMVEAGQFQIVASIGRPRRQIKNVKTLLFFWEILHNFGAVTWSLVHYDYQMSSWMVMVK